MTPFITEEEEKEIRPSIPTCEVGRWFPAFADITAKGDTKQKGIDEIIRYFDIKLEETMAFGDGGNDISMLRHAAIGIAMGQAKEDVKAAADYVTVFQETYNSDKYETLHLAGHKRIFPYRVPLPPSPNAIVSSSFISK